MTSPARSKPIIGVTGGIASGKSLVSRTFRELGAYVIDADALVHQQYELPEVAETVRGWWGDRVIGEDGKVDRAEIASIVFQSPEELQRLEDYLYPRLRAAREKLVEKVAGDASVRAIVLDTPKLFEAGVEKECDATVFVDADRKTRLARVAESRGWSPEELDRREKRQMPLDRKKALADYTVVNHSGTDDLREQVQQVLASVLATFSR